MGTTEPTLAAVLPMASPPCAALPEGDTGGDALYVSRPVAGAAASMAMEDCDDIEEWPELPRALAAALPTQPQ